MWLVCWDCGVRQKNRKCQCFILLPLLLFCPSVSVGIIAVSGGFPRCASLQETLALVRSALVTKDGLVSTVNWLTRLRKRTFRTAVEATHGCWLLFSPASRNTGCTYVSLDFVTEVFVPFKASSEWNFYPNRNNKLDVILTVHRR